MEQKPELRLPTTPVAVTVRLVAGSNVQAELFVNDAVRTGHSQLLEDVASMLAEPSAFVPIRVERQVVLYAKRAILYIAISRREEPDDDFDEGPSEVITLYDRQHHVRVELADGRTLTGTLFDSSPAAHPRVIDHLNRAGHFVRLWTEATHYLINTDQIIRVYEQES